MWHKTRHPACSGDGNSRLFKILTTEVQKKSPPVLFSQLPQKSKKMSGLYAAGLTVGSVSVSVWVSYRKFLSGLRLFNPYLQGGFVFYTSNTSNTSLRVRVQWVTLMKPPRRCRGRQWLKTRFSYRRSLYCS